MWGSTSRRERPSVAIIGGGFGGIGALVKLKEAGFERVTLLERAAGPGGTWWHNHYPGAEVDTPSILYSYSWMPWCWSRTHVRQAELQEYIEAVIQRFGLARQLRFGVSVEKVVWDEAKQEWVIFAEGREALRAQHVVSAVGLLSDPNVPDWEGLADFPGPIFHTSQWDHSVDLTGKRVAVVGSGSTAIQVVPALADYADQVVMFQREPGWIVPKNARPYTDQEREALNARWANRYARYALILEREKVQIGGALWREGTPTNLAARRGALAFIDSELGHRPDLVEAVTPSYPFNSKRPIISDNFYASLLRDNVSLVTRAVKGVSARGVVDADGDEHEVDAIVLATGFRADFLTTFDVIGRDGRSIHELWDGDETAFLGVMPRDVPNFFMLYGPNTNGGAIVSHLQLQIEYTIAAITHAWRRRASAIEVRPMAIDVYDRWLQDRLRGTTFHYENNYYRSSSGRIATQWSDGMLAYGALTKLLRSPLWKLSYKVGATEGRPGQAPPRPYAAPFLELATEVQP